MNPMHKNHFLDEKKRWMGCDHPLILNGDFLAQADRWGMGEEGVLTGPSFVKHNQVSAAGVGA
ncbi:hypothetical protein ACIPY3_21315 [Paenarthrobacter sp. NPDC089714]|uniref:hypothetical protein n=1 Tax=Paenarthrobacter sp. NPDC089714 TaxID=3364377 RepID=UPI00382AB00E